MRLQRHHHQILRRQGGGIVGRRMRPAAERLAVGVEGEALVADGGELGAACHDGHLGLARRDQPRRRIAAHGAGAKDTDLHGGAPGDQMTLSSSTGSFLRMRPKPNTERSRLR